MHILLASADDIFTRMLELEFTERGFTPVTVRTKEDLLRHYQVAPLAIIDAAFLQGEPLPPFPFEAIAFGSPADLMKVPTKELTRYYTVTRPFDISNFIGSLFEAEKAGRTVFRMPKKKKPSEFLALDSGGRMAYFKGKKIDLTKKEFALLALLYENKGKTVTRAHAATAVFGEDGGKTNVVDVYVNYLRSKIDNPFGVKLIVTVRGQGYTIAE